MLIKIDYEQMAYYLSKPETRDRVFYLYEVDGSYRKVADYAWDIGQLYKQEIYLKYEESEFDIRLIPKLKNLDETSFVREYLEED